MAADGKFIEGLIVKAPHERAPEYVKAKLSIKREELIEWLQGQPGDWINADIKVSQNGKWYAAVDDWKPQQGGQQSQPARGSAPAAQQTAGDSEFADDDIPF